MLLVTAIVSGCEPAAGGDAGSPLASDGALTLFDASDCPVSVPVRPPADIGERLFGSSTAYGNADLWVGGLGEWGVILVDRNLIDDDGSLRWKLGWWRVASGQLTITGRRLDGSAPPIDAVIPAGYGSQGFQASSVSFPTEGCWEVTGSVGGRDMTFVTFIRSISGH